jgi:hypothetical protein
MLSGHRRCLAVLSLLAGIPAGAPEPPRDAPAATRTYAPDHRRQGAADPTVSAIAQVLPLSHAGRRGYDVFVSDDWCTGEEGQCFTDRRRGVWAPDVFMDTDPSKPDGKTTFTSTTGGQTGRRQVIASRLRMTRSAVQRPRPVDRRSIDAPLFPRGEAVLYYCHWSRRDTRSCYR